MAYKHGTYGQITKAKVKNAVQIDEAIIYFGIAPVNLIRGYADAGIINYPVKLTNLTNAMAKVGYASAWEKFSLCEAIAYHFNNSIGNVGPIYVINVLNPDIHRAADQTKQTVAFTNGVAYVVSDEIIIDTFAINGKTEGVDYALDYDFASGRLVITALKNDLSGNVEVAYYKVDVSAVNESTIIGVKTSSGIYTGIAAVTLLYQDLSVVPDILAAPGWSHIPNVYKALVSAAQQINGHWDAFVLADIPLQFDVISNYNVASASQGDVPATEKWYELNDNVYSISEDDHVAPGKGYYTIAAEVQTPASENPSEEGWYERTGESGAYVYTLSQDTEPDGEKTYCTVTATAITNADPGDNPASEGWYVTTDNVTYTKTADTYVVTGTTYYEAVTSTTLVDTIEKAKKWKSDNGYASGTSKVCWPQVKSGSDIFHLSTVVAATMLRVDGENDGVPFETPSNKQIMATKQYFGATSTNQGYDQQDANELNEVGITTIINWENMFVVWGPHTAAYTYGGSMDASYIFDNNIRMLMYCSKGFQKRQGVTIDKPMTPAAVESVVISEQDILNSLKTVGALIGDPVIMFLENENSVSDMINGDFVWHIEATPTPPKKSATVKVTYTDEGFSAFFGGES